MGKVTVLVDLEVANQEINNNNTKIQIISKTILLEKENSSKAGGAKEVEASKGSKVM